MSAMVLIPVKGERVPQWERMLLTFSSAKLRRKGRNVELADYTKRLWYYGINFCRTVVYLPIHTVLSIMAQAVLTKYSRTCSTPVPGHPEVNTNQLVKCTKEFSVVILMSYVGKPKTRIFIVKNVDNSRRMSGWPLIFHTISKETQRRTPRDSLSPIAQIRT